MRIAFATSELAPHAQVGGLGDVSRWLPASLAASGDDVRVFVPHYGSFDAGEAGVEPIPGLESVDLGPFGTVSVATLVPSPGPTVYLVQSSRWFGGGAVYLADVEEHLRFGCLSAAVPAICRRLDWTPDLWHLNDWHTALVGHQAASLGLSGVPAVLTIHNLAFQGVFPAEDLGRLGLAPELVDPGDLADGWVNSLRNGIAAAEMVTTVSPTYAGEITTRAQGMGLDAALREKGDRLVGILNGIGDEWDPFRDPHLPVTYGPETLDDKLESTRVLRERLGLRHRPNVPVAGVVSRLTEQKGFELLRRTLPPLLEARRMQLAVIGTGDPTLEAMFSGFAERFPDDAGFIRDFDAAAAHLIEAGSQIFLMPSRFEPCGLNQMYSMRYGTVPVVRRTGGLADSVSEWDPRAGSGTGFLFDDFSDDTFLEALCRALDVHADGDAWRRLQRNGMDEDFSWDRRAAEYREVYRRAIGEGGSGR